MAPSLQDKVKEAPQTDVDTNGLFGEDITSTLAGQRILGEAKKFVDARGGTQNCPDLVNRINEFLSHVDVAEREVESRFEYLAMQTISDACHGREDLCAIADPIVRLEKLGYAHNGTFTEKIRHMTLAEALDDTGFRQVQRVWINGQECVRKEGEEFFPVGDSEHRTKIFAGDTIEFQKKKMPVVAPIGGREDPSSNRGSVDEGVTPRHLDAGLPENFSQEFSKWVANISTSPERFQEFLPQIWDPKGDPEKAAQQQCADTAIALFVKFCSSRGLNFGLNIPEGKSYRFVKMSDFPTPRDFLLYCYPRIGTVHLYGGDYGLFREVGKIDLDRNGRGMSDCSFVRPGDLVCIRHRGGGYHTIIAAGSGSSLEEVPGISGDQYLRDLRKNGKFSLAKARQVLGRDGYETKGDASIISRKHYAMYGGFGAEPELKPSIRGYVKPQKERSVSILRFDPNAFNYHLAQSLNIDANKA